jgi:integrase
MTRPHKITLPKATPGKKRWLTKKEADLLIFHSRVEPRSRDHLTLFIQLALYTGARKGAILDLQWSQVDLENETIDFNPLDRIATDKKRPIIPIPKPLLAILKKEIRHSNGYGPVIRRRGDDPIKDIKRSFATTCKRAGLNDVTPHTLRHTAGTWMAQAGVPLWEIAGWLGHSQQRSTDLYLHHSPEFLNKAREAFE